MEGNVMKANITPEEKQSMIQMVQGLDDNTLAILWKTITTNSGGISGMDPDLLKVFYDEFQKRPGLLESLSESRRRNKMKLTESQLRKRIRKAIIEANNPRYNHISPGGVQLQHGELDSAPTDFHDYGAVAHRMISKGVWPKLSVDLLNAGDWDFYDCGDGWRFIHDCLACVDDEGRVMFAIYCRDRANSANATGTSYDCYVLDCHVIEQNSKGRDPSADWSRWAPKGEYCVNTQQIVDTLEEALETYVQKVVGK